MFRAYTWIYTQGSPWQGLEPYGVLDIKPGQTTWKTYDLCTSLSSPYICF